MAGPGGRAAAASGASPGHDAVASKLHQWRTGAADGLPANPPGTRHQDVNVGCTPIEVVAIELKHEQGRLARPAAAPQRSLRDAAPPAP